MADKLGDFIVGTALETIETEKLIKEFEQVIVKDVYENNTPVHKVVHDLQGYIQSKGIQMNRVVVGNVYQPSSMAERNVTTWLTSKNVESGRSSVTPVSTVVAHESLRMDFDILVVPGYGTPSQSWLQRRGVGCACEYSRSFSS